MARYMKDTLNKDINMAMENALFQKVKNMLEILKWVNMMEKVNSSGQME